MMLTLLDTVFRYTSLDYDFSGYLGSGQSTSSEELRGYLTPLI